MMSCEWFLKNIEAYLEGQLERRDQAKMEAHAARCEACRQELEFSKAIARTVQNLPPLSVPEDFLKRINEQIDQQPAIILDTRYKRFQKKWAGGWRRYSAVAACAVFAVMVRVDAWNLAERMTMTPQDLIGEEQVIVLSATAAPQKARNIGLPAGTASPDSAVIPQFPQEQENAAPTVKPSAAAPKAEVAATAKPAASGAAKKSPAPAATKAPAVQTKVPSAQATPKAHAGEPSVQITQKPQKTQMESTDALENNTPHLTEPPKEQEASLPSNGLKFTPDTVAQTGEEQEAGIAPQNVGQNESSVVDGYREVPGIAYGLYDNVEVPEEQAPKQPRDIEPPKTTTIGNSIAVLEQDEARVLELVEQYKEDTYGSYYFLTEEKLNEFLKELDQEGIHYSRRIVNNEGGNIAFRFVIA